MADKVTPRKAEWALHYDDGSEKIIVAYDASSDKLGDHVRVEMGSSNWLYIDAADVPWLCARLLDAAGALSERERSK